VTKPYRPRSNYIIGLDDSVLTIADFPPQETKLGYLNGKPWLLPRFALDCFRSKRRVAATH
jgi:hypothetical protein